MATGDDVTVLDDLSTGSLENLRGVLDHPGFRFVEGAILDRTAVDSLIAGADGLLHLAAAVGVKLIVEDPLTSLRTNIYGTEVVLDATLAAGAVLLLGSTSEVYGKNTGDSLPEESDRILGSVLKSRWTNRVGQAQRGEILKLFGGVLQTRCFSYVADESPQPSALRTTRMPPAGHSIRVELVRSLFSILPSGQRAAGQHHHPL
ncbi:NAD-dependent epimerase/dehydratase family protein [Arthrobacter sp. 08Y14]|uniref:NAD-dependent epimerase/dehydratase family protein n=1 Tax=Arthrobacter sp. 08Y14 TaxID=2058885 RepID=UPI002157B9E5|nr:NAD-dependent epimerase/dehydratase family protein [Arthrobacter sp. 08Y14]